MPQVFGEAWLPVGNGLSLKAGRFYSFIGGEGFTSDELFFYSFGVGETFGVPYTFTGLLAETQLLEHLKLRVGLTRGWDNWEDNNDDLGLLLGLNWQLSERTSLALALHTGDEDDAGNNNRLVSSLVLKHQLTDRLLYRLACLSGMQDDLVANASGSFDDAQWYGINQQWLYSINEKWKAGLRFEWYRDDDNATIAESFGIPSLLTTGGNYFEFTAGVQWWPLPNVVLRPEARWDWSNTSAPTLGIRGPFDDHSDKNQFTLAVDLVVLF